MSDIAPLISVRINIFKAAKMPQVSSTSPPVGGGPSSNVGGVNSIVNKPVRGWLHPDHLFAKDGINYAVRVTKFMCDFLNKIIKIKISSAVHRLPGGEHLDEGPGL